MGIIPSPDSGTDSRAVSPVIGVILMVAITVILAAVIGQFVLGLGEEVGQTTPQASVGFSVSAASDTVTIDHNGGDTLHSDTTRIVWSVAGSSFTSSATATDSTLGVGDSATFQFNAETATGPAWSQYSWVDNATDIQPGDTITVKVIDTESDRIIAEAEISA